MHLNEGEVSIRSPIRSHVPERRGKTVDPGWELKWKPSHWNWIQRITDTPVTVDYPHPSIHTIQD